MITKLRSCNALSPYFTTTLLENGVGVVIDPAMDTADYLAINVDDYYHHLGLQQVPCIADLVIVGKEANADNFHVFVIEMKNLQKPSFKKENLYNKFETVINDFMKKRYKDPFLETKYTVVQCKLYFVTDAYKLKKKGFTPEEIRSFLQGTKIEMLQNMPPFEYRGFHLIIEYELPNPLLRW